MVISGSIPARVAHDERDRQTAGWLDQRSRIRRSRKTSYCEGYAHGLRGGSFNNESRNVRCAYRNRNNPNNRNNNIGFRIVVSTSFPRCAVAKRVVRASTFTIEAPNQREAWPGIFLVTSFRPAHGKGGRGKQITTAPRPGITSLARGNSYDDV